MNKEIPIGWSNAVEIPSMWSNGAEKPQWLVGQRDSQPHHLSCAAATQLAITHRLPHRESTVTHDVVTAIVTANRIICHAQRPRSWPSRIACRIASRL